jgi:signal peptidase I
MAKDKVAHVRRDPKSEAAAEGAHAVPSQFLLFRETVESIVVAFVLAFLFRTFEAEAFVIPTGSMSPALLGQHKDVRCPECGYSFRTTASSEGEERDKLVAQLAMARGAQADRIKSRIQGLDVIGGMCPMCRYLMPMRADLPPNVIGEVDAKNIPWQPSYPGDRILVNKYGFDFSEPQRWDVVVFKFPGDGNMNYIKRLVGLPGEKLRIFHGDVFTRPLDGDDSQYQIERRTPDKVAAMLQPVHDSDYESSALYKAGWPLRWTPTSPNGWKDESTVARPGSKTVEERFSVDLADDASEAWLRYRHLLPDAEVWQVARHIEEAGSIDELAKEEGISPEQATEAMRQRPHPHLINDFNPYNARLCRAYAEVDGWRIQPRRGVANSGSLGTEWVSDLAMEATVNVQEARGELVLDLVEAGYHFRATIRLDDGKAVMSIVDGRTEKPLNFKAEGKTTLKSAGGYDLRFANVDDQLLLWVNGKLIDCGDTTYDPDTLFEGGRNGMIPWASEDSSGDQGDLAPAGLAARGAKLEATRLAVLRDIYYIAARMPGDNYIDDYDPNVVDPDELFTQRSAWEHFRTRHAREFEVKEGQLFVMGDNSPESKDCRLWTYSSTGNDKPGGPYLDRRLLIGKAICVFWPHSWGHIPGLPMLPGFPNFRDMRLVR